MPIQITHCNRWTSKVPIEIGDRIIAHYTYKLTTLNLYSTMVCGNRSTIQWKKSYSAGDVPKSRTTARYQAAQQSPYQQKEEKNERIPQVISRIATYHALSELSIFITELCNWLLYVIPDLTLNTIMKAPTREIQSKLYVIV